MIGIALAAAYFVGMIAFAYIDGKLSRGEKVPESLPLTAYLFWPFVAPILGIAVMLEWAFKQGMR